MVRGGRPAAGKSRAVRDAARSRQQYAPAITEGGLPVARCNTGTTTAQVQVPKLVPNSSRAEVAKKAVAYTPVEEDFHMKKVKTGHNNTA